MKVIYSTIFCIVYSIYIASGKNLKENNRVKRQATPALQGQNLPPPLFTQPQIQNQQQQNFDPDAEPKDPTCDFGGGEDVNLCEWENINLSMERWEASKGENQYQLGGPGEDNTNGNDQGGYALYETARVVPAGISGPIIPESAMMMSPLLPKTPAIGNCLDFWYVLNGISQDRVRILLRPPLPLLTLETNPIVNVSDEILLNRMKLSDGRDDIVLWEQKDATDGQWTNGQLIYTFNEKHAIIIEGLPIAAENPTRAYTGYIAVDTITFPDAGVCQPFCNFEGGFCSWVQDVNDDFDWSISRGSLKTLTGPPMDRFSFNYGTRGGGYAYIDSGFPRRPGDKARLLSEVFNPTDVEDPLCLRFWTHMYGRGIGSLKVIIAPQTADERVIWELDSEQNNNWYQAQVTLTSDGPFQIVFEATIGSTNLGDIAIDEIAMLNNACPISPQTASTFSGDCTFEVDECGWRNVDNREQLDEADFIRTPSIGTDIPYMDHTFKTPGTGHFMALRQPTISRGGRAWLMSPLLESIPKPMCMSFWYVMNDVLNEQGGSSLGSLQVLRIERSSTGISSIIPVWEVKNHQGLLWNRGQVKIAEGANFFLAIEGVWSNSRGSEYVAIDDVAFYEGDCSTQPPKALKTVLDCDFTRSSCLYMNSTTSLGAQWVPASGSRRPSGLNDKTFNVPVGYLYFDVFAANTNQPVPQVTLMSAIQKGSSDGAPMCLTFFFAPIGRGLGTRLEVTQENVNDNVNTPTSQNGTPQTIWSITVDQLPLTATGWQVAQEQISTSNNYKLNFVGHSTKGGFALDDIKIIPGECDTRPNAEDLRQPTSFGDI